MKALHVRDSRGQALVEFSLALFVFLFLLMAVFDFGRAIYQYNGVAEAAREIARVTATHEGADFRTIAGQSPQTRAVIATQMGLIPNLQEPTITCVGISGDVISGTCKFGDYVNVNIHAPYKPITPFLGLATAGLDLFSSSTSAKLTYDQ